MKLSIEPSCITFNLLEDKAVIIGTDDTGREIEISFATEAIRRFGAELRHCEHLFSRDNAGSLDKSKPHLKQFAPVAVQTCRVALSAMSATPSTIIVFDEELITEMAFALDAQPAREIAEKILGVLAEMETQEHSPN